MAQRNMTLRRGGADVQGTRASIDVGYENAECALEQEQADADALTPDWDMASRITTARGALERGVSADIVRKAYGEKKLKEITSAKKAVKTANYLLK